MGSYGPISVLPTCARRVRKGSRSKPESSTKRAVEHGGREPTRLSVLLADVVAADQSGKGGLRHELHAVPEAGRGPREGVPPPSKKPEIGIPGDGAESQDDARFAERPQFAIQEGRATFDLFGSRVISRRDTPNGNEDVSAREA
jgi:hypothetical protein